MIQNYRYLLFGIEKGRFGAFLVRIRSKSTKINFHINKKTFCKMVFTSGLSRIVTNKPVNRNNDNGVITRMLNLFSLIIQNVG